MNTMVRLSLVTRVPLSELVTWEPESLATAVEYLKDKAEAEKDAAKGR